MPSMPLHLGPFSGGLNTFSGPSAIKDDECAYINNFDIDIDGTLVSRPPITQVLPAQANFTDKRILGTFISNTGVAYIIFTAVNGAFNWVFAYNIAANSYTTILGGLTSYKITCMVQYQDKAWLIGDPAYGTGASNGGYWDGTTFTAVATMAKGVSACLYKERIFVASGVGSINQSQILFCNPSNPSVWSGTDFFYVNNGDGQAIIKLYSFNNSIVVFKADSTYLYSYETSPTRGQIQSVSATIGVDNADCITELEGIIYVISDSRFYGVTNWNWTQLNVKVPFAYVNAHSGYTSRTASLSILGTRIICRYFDSIYIYGIRTQAWTQWTPSAILTPDFWVRSPIKDLVTGVETYFAGNYLLNDTTANPTFLYRFKDAITTDVETGMLCEMRTKIVNEFTYSARSRVYVIPSPFTYKRLMWWGIDTLANTTINSSIKFGTLTNNALQVDDAALITNPNGIRTFVKYIKSIRYRQVQFVVKSIVDGSNATCPFKLFGITAFVSNKEHLSKKVS